MGAEPFRADFEDEPAVVGDLHAASRARGEAVVLTHGAGGDRDGLFLRALCEVFAEQGVSALRCDLPYRQKRPKGPPSPSGAARDREGLRRAVEALRNDPGDRVYLGGSSYGGRQASMLAAEEPDVAAGLLLLSYPLHPPAKPERLRVEHFPSIRVSALFAHGTRDAFGSIGEMEAALSGLGGRWELLPIDGASHGIVGAKTSGARAREVAEEVVTAFLKLVRG